MTKLGNKTPLNVIIFDLGGVVLTNDWHYDCPEKFLAYSNYFGINEDDMEKGWQAAWPQFLLGKITEDEFWSIFLKTAGAKILDVNYAKKLWRRYQTSIDGMLDLLIKLKYHYRLAALTTISREWLDYKRKRYYLDSLFEVIVSSGYFGISKPDLEVYKILLQELNVKPSQCLFIDDTEENLLPARRLGIKTILFTGKDSLENNLKSLGIQY